MNETGVMERPVVPEELKRILVAHTATEFWGAVAEMMMAPINPRAAVVLKLAAVVSRAMGEIARLTGCSLASITQIVDTLEAQGLVKRVHGRTDRRQWFIEPTAEGMELIQRIEERFRM